MNWQKDLPPVLQQSENDKRIFKLAGSEPYTFHTIIQGRIHRVTLFPESQEWLSNLGTIPRFLWPIFCPSEYTEAYFIHDILYILQLGTREEADADLFRRIDQHDRATRAYVIWAGVRLFGRRYWDLQTEIAAKVRGFVKVEDISER